MEEDFIRHFIYNNGPKFMFERSPSLYQGNNEPIQDYNLHFKSCMHHFLF